MEEFLSFLADNQLLIIYGLVFVMFILIILVIIIDYKSTSKKSIITNDNNSVEEITPAIAKEERIVEEDSNKELIIENTLSDESKKIEEINYKDDITREEALEELEEVKETLENNNNSDNIMLTTFEVEQEQNAIISIDELMKKANELLDKNDKLIYEEEEKIPITIEELTKKSNSGTIVNEEKTNDTYETIELLDFETVTDESPRVISPIQGNTTKFQSSPLLSPVFGIAKPANQMEFESTANLEKLNAEIKKTNEFLMIIKDLKEKLDS